MSVCVVVTVAVTVTMVVIVVMRNRLEAGNHRHLGRRLRIEPLSEQQHDESAKQWEQRDQPDLIEEVHRGFTI
jgi:hypothetical protein